jgi:hypothetical protein
VKLFFLVAVICVPPVWGQTAILQIEVVEGEGAVHPFGGRSHTPITVRVTEEGGRPVPGATVSFQLPEDGPSGVFATGLRSEIGLTDAQGRITIRNMRLNRVSGPFEMRITAAKDEVRAGLLSRQYIAASNQPHAKSSRKKWFAVAAIAASAAAGGAVAMRGGGTTGPTSTPTPPAPPPPGPPVIGPPTISIGRP